MSDNQLSFRKSANIDRVTDKRKDSLFRLVDTDGSGTIDAQEFAVLYDAIKKDLAEELEKEAALEKEASSARRRFKMLLLFVAVLISFLAASVAANFAVIFTVVDQAITTTTTSSGFLKDKATDTIAKTAEATQDVPIVVAPALDIETLSTVKSLKVTYGTGSKTVHAQMAIVAVRKHNDTFVEFVTSVDGETIEALNGVASLVRYPTRANRLVGPTKSRICSANATCSAFTASGIDVDAALEQARTALVLNGFHDAERRLNPYISLADCSSGAWDTDECTATSPWDTSHASTPTYVDRTLGACGTYMQGYRVLYYTGYSATRHVVFFLHGLSNDMYAYGTMAHLHMWNYYCDSGLLTCPALTIPAFRHLLFGFMTSGIYFAFSTGSWCTNTFNPKSFKFGSDALGSLVCTGEPPGVGDGFQGCGAPGTWTIPSAWNTATNWAAQYDVSSSSEVMIVGFSNGGGMASYGNYVHGHVVSKAIAIDYHGWHDPVWLSTAHHSATHGDHLALMIFYSCNGGWYSHEQVWSGSDTFHGHASLTNAPASWSDYTTTALASSTGTYFTWTWTDGGSKYLKYSVTGLSSADLTNPSTTCSGTAPGHASMPSEVAIVDEIALWASGDYLSPPSPPVTTGGGKGTGTIGAGGPITGGPTSVLCDWWHFFKMWSSYAGRDRCLQRYEAYRFLSKLEGLAKIGLKYDCFADGMVGKTFPSFDLDGSGCLSEKEFFLLWQKCTGCKMEWRRKLQYGQACTADQLYLAEMFGREECGFSEDNKYAAMESDPFPFNTEYYIDVTRGADELALVNSLSEEYRSEFAMFTDINYDSEQPPPEENSKVTK